MWLATKLTYRIVGGSNLNFRVSKLAMRGGYSGRLSRSLEYKVSQCLEDYKNEGQTDWSVATLYEYCQKSDSSLRRIKKRQLEGIIEKG